jgi:tetratricopeptide (TPR) repeat protein
VSGAEASAVAEADASAVAPAAPERLEAAWRAPAASLRERVARTRRAAVEVGVWNLDAAARAVLAGGSAGDPVEHAQAALRLAPDLPAAHMALARARWLHEDSPIGALRTAAAALAAIPRHPEASLWFAGSGLHALALALIVGGLLCLAAAAAFAAPHVSHDVGDALGGSFPAVGRAALLASLLLLPLALGEGLLGMAPGLLLLGCLRGGAGRSLALALAAAAIWVGAWPVARLSGGALAVLASDPVAAAALGTAQGFSHPADLARLESAGGDELADRALAQRARRAGNLAEADARYQALLERAPADPVLANNAANVRLELGHVETALALYRRALELRESPVVLYNLAQAHGRAFQVEELAQALARAQALDGAVVAELTELQGAEPVGFVADLPLPPGLLWGRALGSGAGEAIAAELRAPFAPGRLGQDERLAAGALAGAALAGALLGARRRPSRSCERCGRRVCPRCDGKTPSDGICDECVRLFRQTESTNRELRLERIQALRRREARRARAAWLASFALPGAAGELAASPARTLLGSLLFAAATSAAAGRAGVVPDPWVAGAAAPLAFLGVAGLCALLYAIVVATALARRTRT